jgi:hypothetical protein
MTRRLLNVLTALSLLLCMAAVVLWVQSCWDPLLLRRTLSRGSSMAVGSEAGGVNVTWRDWWISTGPSPYRWVRMGRTSPARFRWRTLGFGVEWWQQVQRSGSLRASRSVTLPYWFLAAATAAIPGARLSHRLRLRRRLGLCARCGYDLRATPDRCPECGTVKPAMAPS